MYSPETANNMINKAPIDPYTEISVGHSSKSHFSFDGILDLRKKQSNVLMSHDSNRYDKHKTQFQSGHILSNVMNENPHEYQYVTKWTSLLTESATKVHLLRNSQIPSNQNFANNTLHLQSNNNDEQNADYKIMRDMSAKLGKFDHRLAYSSFTQTKSKRFRTVFTPKQLERLEAEFEIKQCISGANRQNLASLLRLSEKQVKIWFQNRKTKWRKQQSEIKEFKLKYS